MNILKSKAEFINKISLYLGFGIILYQIFYHIQPFRYVIETAKLEWISPFMAVSAFALLSIDILVNRVCTKGKYVWLLIGTLAVLSVSAVINSSIGFIDNVKSVIWQSVQMLYLYPLCYRIEKNKFNSTLRNFYLIVSGVFSSACIFSMLCSEQSLPDAFSSQDANCLQYKAYWAPIRVVNHIQPVE